MTEGENLPNPTLDSGQFREYVQNEDFNNLQLFYEGCKKKAEALASSNSREAGILYELYKDSTFLLTDRDSSRRTPLHIVPAHNS